eukprot:GHVR01151982.1.p1 GENE.GHVR01151982.1~~GHVR01151982.1.p1  ORF type:complete len:190 (-),score=19.04 GHVR01151982.1:420-989(-)
MMTVATADLPKNKSGKPRLSSGDRHSEKSVVKKSVDRHSQSVGRHSEKRLRKDSVDRHSDRSDTDGHKIDKSSGERHSRHRDRVAAPASRRDVLERAHRAYSSEDSSKSTRCTKVKVKLPFTVTSKEKAKLLSAKVALPRNVLSAAGGPKKTLKLSQGQPYANCSCIFRIGTCIPKLKMIALVFLKISV